MYAVIIRATVGELDDTYRSTIERMKKLAFENYGCVEFVSMMEANKRIAISYWNSEEEIRHWKKNSEHILAQEAARSKWYHSYIIEVMELKRQYAFNVGTPSDAR